MVTPKSVLLKHYQGRNLKQEKLISWCVFKRTGWKMDED